MSRRYTLVLLLFSFLFIAACEQLENTNAGLPSTDEDTIPPETSVGVSKSFGDYQNDAGRPITNAFDSRIVRVMPGESFYLQVTYEGFDNAAELDVSLVNSSPEGLSGPLDPTQSFFTLGQPTGISEPTSDCDLSDQDTQFTCTYEVSVSEDAVNIDALEGSEDEFAYIFSAPATDVAGSSTKGQVRGYVIIGDDTVDIPDEVLERVVREELGKPTGDLTPRDFDTLFSLDYFGSEGQRIESLEGLQYASRLTNLSLRGNKIESFTPLQYAPIEELIVISNNLTDLTSLQDVAAEFGGATVTSIQLTANEVSDLTPTASFPNLRPLFASNNQITSLAPLEGLTNLTDVEVENNQISDLSPLVNNPGLGEGDFIVVLFNPLETCPGTEDRADIDTLIERGVEVFYDIPEGCNSN